MVTEELLNFVRAQFASGMHPDEIERLLVNEGGWDKGDVEEAMISLGLMKPVIAPPAPTPETVSVPVTSPAPMPTEQVFTPPTPVTPEVTNTEAVIAPTPEEEVPPLPATELPSTPSSLVLEPSPLQGEAEIKNEHLEITEPTSLPSAVDVSVAESGEVHDDFLGIFDGTQPSSSEQEMSVAAPTPAKMAFDLSSATEAPQVIAQAEVSPAVVQDVPQASPLSFEPPVTPTSSPETTPVSTAPVVAAVPGVRFDFSSLNKESETPQAQTPISGGTDINTVLGKTIETKSAAEAWLQGAQKPELGVTTPSDSVEKPQTKSAVSRTMGSDILLRGVGATIAGIPSLLPQEEKPEPIKETPATPIISPEIPKTPLAEDLMRKNKIKKIFFISIGALAILGLILGGVFFMMKMRGPDKVTLFNTVFSNFLASSAFGYKGSGSVDLILSTMTTSGEQKGAMKFDLTYGGALANGQSGYGNGSHRLKLAGGLQSGEFLWSTDIETDVRVVGDVLYFHVLSLPESADMDPSVLETYWIKVNLSDIAKELALQGVAASQEGYGNFGGSAGDTSFNTLISKATPFTVGDAVAEAGQSKSVLHYKLQPNPDKMVEFAQLLMRKYMNKDLILTDEKKLRLKDAFAKMTGDVWVNSETGTVMKLSISGNFDDDMFDMHVKGPVALSFSFSDFNKAVTVDTPTPILTLEELQTRTEDYKKVKAKREHDQLKLDRLSFIKDALILYYDQYKKYPATLTQLEQSGKLATSSVDGVALKQYSYVSYVKDGVFTKAGRCTAKGKTCEYYHIGVNFEDITNPMLESDADKVDDILGKDTSGCSGESDVACYDIVSSPQVSALPGSGMSTTSAATTSQAN